MVCQHIHIEVLKHLDPKSLEPNRKARKNTLKQKAPRLDF